MKRVLFALALVLIASPSHPARAEENVCRYKDRAIHTGLAIGAVGVGSSLAWWLARPKSSIAQAGMLASFGLLEGSAVAYLVDCDKIVSDLKQKQPGSTASSPSTPSESHGLRSAAAIAE